MAGLIPTVRHEGERLAVKPGAKLIRINPREAAVPSGQIALAGGAAEMLQALDRLLAGGNGPPQPPGSP